MIGQVILLLAAVIGLAGSYSYDYISGISYGHEIQAQECVVQNVIPTEQENVKIRFFDGRKCNVPASEEGIDYYVDAYSGEFFRYEGEKAVHVYADDGSLFTLETVTSRKNAGNRLLTLQSESGETMKLFNGDVFTGNYDISGLYNYFYQVQNGICYTKDAKGYLSDDGAVTLWSFDGTTWTTM